MDAYHNYTAELQRRRYMERDCQYKRRCPGYRLGTARFIFRSRYGKNLRFVLRCEETGTRTEAIYQVRTCQRCDHLRYGADACPV